MARWHTLRFFALGLLCLHTGGASAQAAPCTTATAACTQWVTLGAGPQRVLVYASHALKQRNERIVRAFINVHGQGRDADNYFRNSLAAAFLADGLEDTLVIAPRLASGGHGNCKDRLAEHEANWFCSGPDSWRSGGPAQNNAAITSFDASDDLLRLLADKQVFPNLTTVVVGGHSAGGQYTARYAMANQVHDKLGLSIRYVVSNPSSYTYLDAERPTVAAYPPQVAWAPPGYQPPLPAAPPPAFAEFGDRERCTAFDDWPYGSKRRTGYAARLGDAQLRSQFAARPVTYLVGELDILPLYGFDASCAAMAQGPTRLARALAYGKYANDKLGAKHQVVMVNACGHNGRCMVTADRARSLLFPREAP